MRPKQPLPFRWPESSPRPGAWRSPRPWKVAGGLRFGFGLRLATVSTLLAALSLPGSVSFAQPYARGGNTVGRVVYVDERLDLTLDDGTKLKIGGIDPARPTPANP